MTVVGRPGASLDVPRSASHGFENNTDGPVRSFKNNTDRPVRILIVCAAAGVERGLSQADGTLADTPAAIAARHGITVLA